jgi:hypothetical protein
MTTRTTQRLATSLLTFSLIALGVPACGDDVDDVTDAGDNESGSGGKGGSTAGGKGGSTSGGKGGSNTGGKGGGGSTEEDGGVAAEIDSKAANLRVALNLLLGEHLIFAAKATGAALGDRTSEFEAYGELLNKNGTDLGAAVKAAFDAAAETEFNRIWSAHNGFFVDYTTGVATDDTAKKDEAVKDLTETYVPEFRDFLNGATGLPKATLEELITDHVLQTKAIVDAQAGDNWADTYKAIKTGFDHMSMIADPLAAAIASKQSSKFPGDGATKAVDLRVALNHLLQEHLYIATFATAAALGNRTGEFTAAGDALNDNGTAIGAAIGDLYNQEAETQFNGIWSAHNGFFVDYTTGVATDDMAKKDEAVKDLTETYVPDFADFLNGATGLPKATLSDLIGEHVLQTKTVVDAQGADSPNWKDVAAADREAAQHMQMLADPLSAAIVEKVPGKF